MSKFKLLTTILLTGTIALMTTSAYAKKKERTNGRGAEGFPTIYVTSQGLHYDTLLLGELPFNDTMNFQLLEMGPMGPQTEFGPTDTGYYGGRWWMDDGDGIMEPEDFYFLCPLLGPGRTEP